MHGEHGSSASVSLAGNAALAKHHRYSSRSNSISGSSASTIKRTASLSSSSTGARNSVLPLRSQSPVDTSLIALRLGGNRRKSLAVDPSESSTSEGLGNLNRWSQSTDSSATSGAHTRRHRASSGAVLPGLQPLSSPRVATRTLVDHSPRSSPHRNPLPSPSSKYRRNNLSTDSPELGRRLISQTGAPNNIALPPFHLNAHDTSVADNESFSTVQSGTPSTTGLLTPSTHSSYAQDYFSGENVSPGTSYTKRPAVARNVTAPGATLNYSRMPRSEAVQDSAHSRRQSELIPSMENETRAGASCESRSDRRPRTRERTEKDKKAMLSKALQQANTAVLLDNAQNFEGALEAYSDACRLLQHVMDRSAGADDKRKLEAIRFTYTNRIDELRQIEDSRPPTREEKGLPTRPMSDDSIKSPVDVPTSPLHGTLRDSAIIETATMARIADVPRLSYPARDRDSFFSRTIADVERAGRSNEDLTREQRQPSPLQRDAVHEETTERDEGPFEKQSIHLPPHDDEDSTYMPAPLLPRKIPSPTFEPTLEPVWRAPEPAPEPNNSMVDETPLERIESNAPVSWLDTIDESGSSCGSSVHSLTSQKGKRRKHLRNECGETDAEFDAAFDAAVEAAYDEGLEPDLGSQDNRKTAIQHARQESIMVPSGDIKEILSPTASFHHSRAIHEEFDDDEEERILDEFTQDYGHGFNFDLQTKSALPRQSDSSGYSRSTWQSSQVSDRATATTSLSTVPEDLLSSRHPGKPISMVSSINTVRADSIPPPLSPPPTGALPKPPSLSEKRASSTVRSRRLSGHNLKQLKIETSGQPEGRKRASTFHVSPNAPHADKEEQARLFEQEVKAGALMESVAQSVQQEHALQSPPSLELRSAVSQSSLPPTTAGSLDQRKSLDESPGEMKTFRPSLFRKNKSSVSLRDHSMLLPTRDDSDLSVGTPLSTMFGSKAGFDPLTSQRSNFALQTAPTLDGQYAGGAYLFDTALSNIQAPGSPRSVVDTAQPAGLEPCPDSFLLRPFWLMRGIGSTITHSRGGFLTTRLFVPREVWQTRGVKIKAMDDKTANCDLLTAALGRLAGVDTYDADAVMAELQSFEEVMERVQSSLVKKLGSDVGVHGAAATFRDAPGGSTSGSFSAAASDAASVTDKSIKSNSGKSYLTSWRKLRSKSSGAPLSTVSTAQKSSGGSIGAEKNEPLTMASVPMTSFVPVERRGQKAGRDVKGMVFEGPQKEYMGSLARLVQGVGVLDQIARQVEDPGLRHSSQTHVGLELSIRHAAEFFAFYVCRFVLADLGLLIDKFVKRGTEWALN